MRINPYAVTSSQWVNNADQKLFKALLAEYAGVMLPYSAFSTGTGKSYVTIGFTDVMDFNQFEIAVHEQIDKPREKKEKPTWLQRILRSFL